MNTSVSNPMHLCASHPHFKELVPQNSLRVGTMKAVIFLTENKLPLNKDTARKPMNCKKDLHYVIVIKLYKVRKSRQN